MKTTKGDNRNTFALIVYYFQAPCRISLFTRRRGGAHSKMRKKRIQMTALYLYVTLLKRGV